MITCFLLPLFLFSSLFSSQLWCLWRALPQEQNAYPDGFVQCPDLSYKVQNDRNVTIKCTSCPDCPPGHEPTPPCGSTIFKETPIWCRMCRTKTYSDEYGSGTCKPCQRCGSRETISPCTPEKATQCGDCPRKHYQEDFTIDSCKECSRCCPEKSYAELECIYLKQCKRKNCTKEMGNKQSRVPKLSEIIQTLSIPGRTTTERRKEHRVALQSITVEKIGMSIPEDILSTVKNPRLIREVKRTLQKDDVNAHVTAIAEASSISKADGLIQPATGKLVAKSTSQEGLDIATEQNIVEPTVSLNSSYFGSFSKRLNVLVVFVVLIFVALIFIAIILVCNSWKRMPSGQLHWKWSSIAFCLKNEDESEEYQPMLQNSPPQSGQTKYWTIYSY